MVFDAPGQAYNQNCAADDGMRSCPLDAGPSSYYYGSGPYDYVHGLADRFQDVLHAAEQPLWNGCITSQWAVVAELVDIKVDGQKDDIDMDYCKFCGEVTYKPTRERNPNRKKIPYAVLRYLPITPRLQRLYASQVTVEQMTWHANHRRRRDLCATRLMRRRGGILIGHTPILQRSHIMLDWVCALMGSHYMGSTVACILVGPLYLHRTIFHWECA
ncbi:UNVERIFIED_CONTAM: hypothetical protein Slati_4173200 [Sesamum latifolium]|uniref:Uncharacterized protein n=1 Tax=Sesamum latifolium TaxID=2727402 RepID=A0AAW2TBF9_9LAMI